MKTAMRPNNNVVVFLQTRAGESIEIQLTHKRSPIGMFEVLREILLSECCLIVDVE
jgi:hypothetical protein